MVVGRALVVLLWRRGASCVVYWGCVFLTGLAMVAVEGVGGFAEVAVAASYCAVEVIAVR